MEQIEQFLSNHSLARRSLIVGFIVLCGIIDFSTGYEFSFSFFYLIPISIAAWFDTRKITLLTVLLSGLSWFLADYGSGNVYSYSFIPYWNVTVRLAFFCVVAILLFKVRVTLNALTEMAMKDTLTSLDNSRSFNLQYQQIRKYKNKAKNGQKLAVGIIDLDGFKNVNDTYGHSKGDDILVEFAQILKSTTRKTDTVARLGGDEFVVILQNTDQSGTEEYARRLRDIFDQSGLKQRYGVDFSMGVSVFNALPADLDDATHVADQLMYKSKALGKSQTTIRVT